MATAQKRVEKYAEWEHYGDKETDDPGNLDVPPHRKGCFMTTLCSCKEQFTQSVTASSLCHPRFYVSRNVRSIAPRITSLVRY